MSQKKYDELHIPNFFFHVGSCKYKSIHVEWDQCLAAAKARKFKNWAHKV